MAGKSTAGDIRILDYAFTSSNFDMHIEAANSVGHVWNILLIKGSSKFIKYSINAACYSHDMMFMAYRRIGTNT